MTGACEDDLLVIVFFNSGESQLEVNSQNLWKLMGGAETFVVEIESKTLHSNKLCPKWLILAICRNSMQKLEFNANPNLPIYVCKLVRSVEKMTRTAPQTGRDSQSSQVQQQRV